MPLLSSQIFYANIIEDAFEKLNITPIMLHISLCINMHTYISNLPKKCYMFLRQFSLSYFLSDQ